MLEFALQAMAEMPAWQHNDVRKLILATRAFRDIADGTLLMPEQSDKVADGR